VSERLCLSYTLPAPESWTSYLRQFEEFVVDVANYFLSAVWDEQVIDEIHAYGLRKNGNHSKPAYKFFEQKKLLPDDEWWKELPSRFRRGIMEKVGRTLRSQKERKDCFYDVLPVFLDHYDLSVEDVRKRKWKAFKKIRQNLIANEKYHDYNLLKQVIYQIANYYEANGRLPEKYTECVKSEFKSGTFPFDVDDGKIGLNGLSGDKGRLFQMYYKIEGEEVKLMLKVKLPVVKDDRTVEWRWFEEEVEAYPKFEEMLKKYGIKKPVLVRRRLKSGFHQYQFVFPFEVKVNGRKAERDRCLSIDLNERKLIAAVVMDSNSNQLPHCYRLAP